MQVCLVSGDLKLRGFLGEIAGSGSFSLLSAEKAAEADFYIFDFDPAVGVSPIAEPGAWNQLFVVDPKDLPAFGRQIRHAPVCMLLKPVTRPAFEAFLTSFRERWSARSRQKAADQFRSDRDELFQHLLQANLKLQEYDQERTHFLARALHDLRTPLMSLRGLCGLLLEGKAGPLNPQQRELLQRMESSSGRLARLSSGMFELSIEGRVDRPLRLEAGNIESCVHNAVQEVGAFLQEKQITIRSKVVPPPKAMFMESQQIEQLLINLLENACRFTPRLGKIEIQGYPQCWDFDRSIAKSSAGFPNSYRIDVKDSGPGIEPAMVDAIFEQYTSIAANDRSGGGLGLAICKIAATAHRGRIWATSSKEGAIFSVLLPLDPRIADERVRRFSVESRPRTVQAG
jgi:signal transduction histidine kinase